jgi:hypothetical protein
MLGGTISAKSYAPSRRAGGPSAKSFGAAFYNMAPAPARTFEPEPVPDLTPEVRSRPGRWTGFGCIISGHRWGEPFQGVLFQEDSKICAQGTFVECERCGARKLWQQVLREEGRLV